MGDAEQNWMRQEKYRKLYNRPRFAAEDGFHFQLRRPGGIFREKTRQRLLGTARKSGRGKKSANFWYDVRETVKTALIDIQLFVETADEEDVIKALKKDALEAIVQVFFTRQERDDPKLVGQKAKIAQLFAESGLEYLRQNAKYLTEQQLQEISRSAKRKNR